jgi:hypothetical protein
LAGEVEFCIANGAVRDSEDGTARPPKILSAPVNVWENGIANTGEVKKAPLGKVDISRIMGKTGFAIGESPAPVIM